MAAEDTPAAPAITLAAETVDDSIPRVKLEHWFFNKMDEVYFHLEEASKEPALVAKYDKNDVILTIKGVIKEFHIKADSADGRMLEQISKGLKYVKALRVGDPLPKEIITREASWALAPRHKKVAYQRVSLQLVNWMSGTDEMITDPDQLLQLADDPAIKKSISTAFGEVAERMGYGRDHKESVVKHVEELAEELAYIEALRDRFRRIKMMESKIQEMRRLYGRERSVLEIADQVARLGERAVADFHAMFLEVDAQTGEILAVLKNLAAQIPYIRDKRDELHIRLMAWDEILDRWQHVEMRIHRDNPNLLRDTYKFLAPRFMMVQEWVLVTQLHAPGGKAAGQTGAAAGKKMGSTMIW